MKNLANVYREQEKYVQTADFSAKLWRSRAACWVRSIPAR